MEQDTAPGIFCFDFDREDLRCAFMVAKEDFCSNICGARQDLKLFKHFGCEERILFKHFWVRSKPFCSNMLGAKQDFCSNTMDAKKDFYKSRSY